MLLDFVSVSFILLFSSPFFYVIFPFNYFLRLIIHSMCVHRVYVMGGALRVPGNVSPLAEFNFANDASAASSVIVAFSKKIIVIPLDATMQCLLSKNDLEELSRNSGVVGHWFAKSVAPFYMQAYRSHNGVDMPLHDAHTVGALIQPDLYAGQSAHPILFYIM